MAFTCSLCGNPVDPASPTTYTRIEGWSRKGLGANRRGGYDVVLREALDEYSHGACIDRKKMGVPVAQESLSL